MKIPQLKNLKKLALFTLIIAVIAIAVILIFNYSRTQKELSAYKGDQDATAIKERNELLKTLGRLVVLPQDEEPTIATVTDAFRLRGQKFFAQVENGDKVIIYPKSQRAILYRPSLKRVIESAPVNINDINNAANENTNQLTDAEQAKSDNYVLGDSDKATEKPQPEVEEQKPPQDPTEPAKLAIYNGTLFIAGLANDVAEYVKKQIGEDKISVDIVANAEESYEETIIINVSEKYNGMAKQLEELLSGQSIEKPADVNFPEVDIIIIAGKDVDLGSLTGN